MSLHQFPAQAKRVALLSLLIAMLAVTGCRNPVNAKTYDRYYQTGMLAERSGDLPVARRDYSRALWNAQAGWLGPKAEAYALYEWSRVTGYLGHYAEAEQGFREVLTLVEKSNGAAGALRAPALCELARLLLDTRQYAAAAPVFEQAITALEKRQAQEQDPLAFAALLDDYAAALREQGSTARADEVGQRAASIRRENPGATTNYQVRRYAN